jgi:hypothetical protein
MEPTKDNLRVEFVEMLFALAIAQVAIEFSEAIFHKISFNENPHVYSHLFLGSLIITMSWIGWQNSRSKGNTLGIESIFSTPFLILLTDISLVIFYFIIVRGADFSIQSDKAVTIVDVTNELLLSALIFGVYIFWDFITKGVELHYKNNGGQAFSKSIKFNLNAFFQRTWPGVICLIATVCFFKYYNSPVTPWGAFVIDVSLFFIFVLFRGLKPDIKRRLTTTQDKIPASAYHGVLSSGSTVNVTDQLYIMKLFVGVILPIISIIVGYLIVKKV